MNTCKKIIPITSPRCPECSKKLRFPDYVTWPRMVVRLSALRTGRFLPPGNNPATHFCQRLSQPQGNSAFGRIMSMKNFSDIIRIRTRDLPACKAVPQPTAPPRAPTIQETMGYFEKICSSAVEISTVPQSSLFPPEPSNQCTDGGFACAMRTR